MHVAHFVHRSARRHPDRPLWLLENGRITYREGAVRLNRLARGLLARGEPGDRVAILSTNRFEAYEIYLAAMNAGMAAVPMNPKLHPAEHAFMLADSGARFLVHSPDYDDHVAAMGEGVLDGVALLRFDGAAGAAADYRALMEGQADGAPDPAIDPDDLAWLFYTSGTTGQPKGAMETHRNLVTMVEQFLIGIFDDIGPGDVMFHAAPISHGTASCGLPHLAVGAAQAFPLSRSFEPARIFEAIERYRVTASFLAPTMIQMLLGAPKRERYDLSSLRNVVYGGGPMHVALLKEALAAFGPVFTQIYGQGEAPMTCTTLPRCEHVVGGDADTERRLASAGCELPGVEVRIVDGDDLSLPAGEMGEIVVRGDLVMKGYWNRPEATAETLRGGWLHTGDVGFLDDAGYLFLTDRIKDLIISGGSNIYPREVEEAIRRHPDIVEVAVIGVPDETWGEAVKAVVVVRPGAGLDEADVIEHCRAQIASFKKPRSVEFVESLPKNANGKILKRELRDRYWPKEGRRL